MDNGNGDDSDSDIVVMVINGVVSDCGNDEGGVVDVVVLLIMFVKGSWLRK